MPPSSNIAAEEYTELLGWEGELIAELPETMALSSAELDGARVAPLAAPCYPGHDELRVGRESCQRGRGKLWGEKQCHGFICG